MRNHKLKNYYSLLFSTVLVVIITTFIFPYLVKAEATKIKVECEFGRIKKTVECYYNPNSLIGGRMSVKCVCCGQCQLADALAFGLNIADLILKFLGVIALGLFIYGGILWIFSGGNPDTIKTGKAVVTGALVGMVIVLAAFLIVQTILKNLGVKSDYLLEEGPSKCAEQYGKNGFKCINENECSPPIYTGLCPGPKEIVCCVPMKETNCFQQYGNQGYACRKKLDCDETTIKTGLCPGSAEIVCCKLKQ
jgi:hypothetical protein